MNIRLSGLILIAFIAGLSSCKNTNDAPVTTGSIDSLNVINASADTVNFYLNGTRLNNNSNLYPGGASGYYEVPSGQQTYQVKKIFNPAKNAVQTLFGIPLPLVAHHYYSLFVVDETVADAFSTLDILQQDTVANTCYIRFVNASPNAGNLDLAIGSSVKLANLQFKSSTAFMLADTGTLVPINVYQAGAATPLFSGKVNLSPGYSYTFYSKGKLNGTGNSVFGLGSTINYN